MNIKYLRSITFLAIPSLFLIVPVLPAKASGLNLTPAEISGLSGPDRQALIQSIIQQLNQLKLQFQSLITSQQNDSGANTTTTVLSQNTATVTVATSTTSTQNAITVSANNVSIPSPYFFSRSDSISPQKIASNPFLYPTIPSRSDQIIPFSWSANYSPTSLYAVLYDSSGKEIADQSYVTGSSFGASLPSLFSVQASTAQSGSSTITVQAYYIGGLYSGQYKITVCDKGNYSGWGKNPAPICGSSPYLTITNASASPYINSITPNVGEIGAAVTLAGNGFSTSSPNTLFFGKNLPSITAASTDGKTITFNFPTPPWVSCVSSVANPCEPVYQPYPILVESNNMMSNIVSFQLGTKAEVDGTPTEPATPSTPACVSNKYQTCASN